MKFSVPILVLTITVSACQTKVPPEPAVLDLAKAKPEVYQAKSEPEITPSKIYGIWKLEYLNGLGDAYDAEEKLHSDRGEVLLWNTEISPTISYRFVNGNKTLVSTFGCNGTVTAYTGVIKTGLDDITRTDNDIPPTLRACFSEVRTASGEIKQTGRAAVEVAADVLKSNQPNFSSFRLEDDNNTLIFYDVLGMELARFLRWGLDD